MSEGIQEVPPSPSVTSPAASSAAGPDGERRDGEQPRWPASIGVVGLLVALFGTLVLTGVIALIYIAIGFEDPEKSSSFDFAAIAAQSAVFVAAALIMTQRLGRPTARQFGFRPFNASAIGWALLALATYFVLSLAYVQLAHPPQDDLPQRLGADQSTTLAVITGVFVIGVAPPIEEFFFRGFLYQALRNRLGVGGGALLSGLIFGAVHFEPAFLVPLAILGTALALLFQKTNSLWPCILAHGLNNALAFAVTL